MTIPPAAHSIELDVQAADIDEYSHVNNAVYLTWLDRAAWSHSAALGMPLERCIALRRGMAALRTEIDYERAALAGDRIRVATWIADCDGKLRCTRHFVVSRAADEAVLARAITIYVCLNLDTGRAARMPPEFVAAYGRTSAAQP